MNLSLKFREHFVGDFGFIGEEFDHLVAQLNTRIIVTPEGFLKLSPGTGRGFNAFAVIRSEGQGLIGGQFLVAGTGPNAIGDVAPPSNRAFTLGGTFTPLGGTASGSLLYLNSALNVEATLDGYGLHIEPNFVEAGSGTHVLLASVRIERPTATVGAATVTNSAALYIVGHGSGITVSGTNYALWIDDGSSRFDGAVDIQSSLQCDSIVNDTGLAAGTYTVTYTNVANLDSTPSTSTGQYMRVGNTVTVSGVVTVDPTAATTSTKVGISLPVASNFTSLGQCAGTAFAPAIANQGAAILADTTNDRAQMEWISGDVSSQNMAWHFTYTVA